MIPSPASSITNWKWSSTTTSTSLSNSIYTITDATGWPNTESYTFYVASSPPDPIKDFGRAVSARRALFLAWNKEAQTTLFKMTFDKMPFPGRSLDRLCYPSERKALPTRQLFRKRVCGGHQRYRVMQP